MLKKKLAGLNKNKLRRWLILFFLALAIPTAVLIQQSYSRLKWETFHQHQLVADELAYRIDQKLLQLINKEEQRAFTDYAFLNVAGNPSANFIQRSPLSHYPVQSAIPGVIGYFQVDSAGLLQTPLRPKQIASAQSYGITSKELRQRTVLHQKIRSILTQNHLVKTSLDQRTKRKPKLNVANKSLIPSLSSRSIASKPIKLSDSNADKTQHIKGKAESIQGQAAFDNLKKEIRHKTRQKKSPLQEEKIHTQVKKRREKNVLPESIIQDSEQVSVATPSFQSDLTSLRISTFESEIDPFEFSQLESGHFVFFRKVWLNKQRYIQGILIEQQTFLDKMVNSAFTETTLSPMSHLLVIYQGHVLKSFSGQLPRGYLTSHQALTGEILFQTHLSHPLNDIELLFSITQLPAGPGSEIIMWLALVVAFILFTGFYLIYRLGVSQINLANQQQDFVSAVSHELKTPLTSIRMYGEILREGWASKEQQHTYYDFIFDESERLSRLINNVLHLAKMTRNEQQVVLKKLTVSELMDGVRSKVSSQIERAGFEFEIVCDDSAKMSEINVDADWFSQIMINLVDNAIKFSAQAECKRIELNGLKLRKGAIQFTVRDFGPGIERQQMKKIFSLFYRTENELTRETVGTGIGLALVHHMVINMKGKIDVVNKKPGAEFQISFPPQR